MKEKPEVYDESMTAELSWFQATTTSEIAGWGFNNAKRHDLIHSTPTAKQLAQMPN
jgi:hypothetical protein